MVSGEIPVRLSRGALQLNDGPSRRVDGQVKLAAGERRRRDLGCKARRLYSVFAEGEHGLHADGVLG
ncbi:hypothetical protein [Terrabacter ginsenosidimutans]|uniref:hypothetical protein n=1 Tax=Terrabacter ginsenosidimutans TaxID=490575 RepID=UPI0031E96416